MQATHPTERLFSLLKEIKRLARKYYELTQRPLGVTDEIAECEAFRLLDLERSPVRQAGYDAIRRGGGKKTLIQIKGRRILPNTNAGVIGSFKLDKKWDSALLILLDEDYEATAIYEASRKKIKDALRKPGSRARNERGTLSVSKFKSKSISKKIWPNLRLDFFSRFS